MISEHLSGAFLACNHRLQPGGDVRVVCLSGDRGTARPDPGSTVDRSRSFLRLRNAFAFFALLAPAHRGRQTSQPRLAPRGPKPPIPLPLSGVRAQPRAPRLRRSPTARAGLLASSYLKPSNFRTTSIARLPRSRCPPWKRQPGAWQCTTARNLAQGGVVDNAFTTRPRALCLDRHELRQSLRGATTKSTTRKCLTSY